MVDRLMIEARPSIRRERLANGYRIAFRRQVRRLMSLAMNSLLRLAALVAESFVYGPPYGYLNYLIRSPKPLDPEET